MAMIAGDLLWYAIMYEILITECLSDNSSSLGWCDKSLHISNKIISKYQDVYVFIRLARLNSQTTYVNEFHRMCGTNGVVLFSEVWP